MTKIKYIPLFLMTVFNLIAWNEIQKVKDNLPNEIKAEETYKFLYN